MSDVSDIQVSVIVPAYNAEGTLDETLASLQSQRFRCWEAIIVNDGSTDGTATVAARWAKQDGRMRLLSQRNSGHSAARNTGIRAARYDWLLFLDADDWLAPEYLERMTHVLAADPQLDAVVCGSVRVTPSGKLGRPALFEPSFGNRLFAAFAQDCPFAIHSCLVRHSVVKAVGGFDPNLRACGDWDFWQRVARAGPRLSVVREVLAFYRVRPGSVSTNAERFLSDGMTVIRRGHARDPRVPAPHPEYANGLPSDGLPEALFRHALWPASLVLARGGDARPLLRLLAEERAPSLDPFRVASRLFQYVPIAAGRSREDWPELWPVVKEQLGAFLVELEAQSGAVELGQRSMAQLEWLILNSADLKRPFTIGATYSVHIDVDRPIADVAVPDAEKWLHCVVEAAGQYVGSIQLEILGRVVTGMAIADAITTNFAWSLLCKRFRVSWPRNSRLGQCLCLLRRPRLLGLLLRLVLGMRSVRMDLQPAYAESPFRRGRVKEFVWAAARRMVRVNGLVTAAQCGESTQTTTAQIDP